MTTRNAPTTAADAATRLHALSARVQAIPSLRCTMTVRGLMVLRPDDDATDDFGPSELITCEPRKKDGGRLWFFGEDGEPLAPADDTPCALLQLLGKLKS